MYKTNKQQGSTIYSTENYTQYSLITYTRKEYGIEWMSVYIYLNLFVAHLKLIPQCK